MRLTVYTDYSLRVLMYVALHPERRPTITEVASRYGISKNHIMKVVHQLGVAGYIATIRGQSGGMRLARPPQDIILGEVVRRTEPDMALMPCFDPINAVCVITPACRLRGALHQAQSAFLAVLDGYSLAELVENNEVLRELFVASPPTGAVTQALIFLPPGREN
jgi:Rrf2 family nitric oxide-sensitive transcriptional repressor